MKISATYRFPPDFFGISSMYVQFRGKPKIWGTVINIFRGFILCDCLLSRIPPPVKSMVNLTVPNSVLYFSGKMTTIQQVPAILSGLRSTLMGKARYSTYFKSIIPCSFFLLCVIFSVLKQLCVCVCICMWVCVYILMITKVYNCYLKIDLFNTRHFTL